jgi:hypothetical protein
MTVEDLLHKLWNVDRSREVGFAIGDGFSESHAAGDQGCLGAIYPDSKRHVLWIEIDAEAIVTGGQADRLLGGQTSVDPPIARLGERTYTRADLVAAFEDGLKLG